VRNRERDQRLLALGERTVGSGDVAVIPKEIVGKRFRVPADFAEFLQVRGVVIAANLTLRPIVEERSANITAEELFLTHDDIRGFHDRREARAPTFRSSSFTASMVGAQLDGSNLRKRL